MMADVSHLPAQWEMAKFGHFPAHLARAVRREWMRRRNRPLRDVEQRVGVLDDGREAEANTWLRQLVDLFPVKALELGAHEEALVTFAKARAEEAENLTIEGADLGAVQAFCHEHGLELPNGETDESVTRRAGCSLWWRRNLRKVNARKAEALSIGLGLVHKRAGLYSSHDAVNRRREQKRRNRALLDALKAINELGDEFTLSDLADRGMSNPAIRRAELMTRIAGFEYIARSLELEGEFITLTAPSHYHPRRAASGQRNPKFDGYSTPSDTRDYLGKVWSRITAALARADVKIFGFRVAEPHHDGTPHMHGLFFLKKEDVKPFRAIVARYAVREDREELGLNYADNRDAAKEMARTRKEAGEKGYLYQLMEKISWEAAFWASPPRGVWKSIAPRVCFKAIDWSKGTAAGYIAKYVAKNIDGLRADGSTVGQDFEALGGVADGDDGATRAQDHATDTMVTARRVDAWAATWGIRQFQQVGGPPVGVWRELRRWDYADAEDVLMQAAVAADAGHWARFVEVMGGYEMKRRDMPLQLAKDMQGPNRYGEEKTSPTKVFGVVEVGSGQLAVSRMHEWKVLNVREADAWTRVNNSTKSLISVNQGKPAMPATPDEIDRWLDEMAEDTSRRATQPLEDSFLPPPALAERQRKQRDARREFGVKRDTLCEFMGFVDEWVHGATVKAAADRETTLQRVNGRALYQRFTGISVGRGLGMVEDVRARHAEAGQVQIRPFARWKVGRSESLADQLAAEVTAARALLAKINPDPHGVFNVGR